MSDEVATQELAFDERFTRALNSVGLRHPKEEDPTEVVETVEQNSTGAEKAADARVATPINLFQHPDTHPIALDLALLRRYGVEWLTWEPETLELRIPIDFRTNSLSALNLDKLMAVKTLHVDDGFWKRWEIFSACVPPLNDTFTDFEVLQVPTYAEVLVAADIAARIRDDLSWSTEVEDYIRTVMVHDGVFLGIAPLDKIQLEAGHGAIEEAHLIEAAWPGVRSTRRAPADDSVVSEQLRRLLVVQTYLDQNRDRLREQLPLVLST